jgi:hypothetical protein
VASEDSPVVANFKRAGAIIFGRTNTPAFSMRIFADNALHGRALNPRDPAVSDGGSSGGAGAAVATGIGPIAHGNDIGKSVRIPHADVPVKLARRAYVACAPPGVVRFRRVSPIVACSGMSPL